LSTNQEQQKQRSLFVLSCLRQAKSHLDRPCWSHAVPEKDLCFIPAHASWGGATHKRGHRLQLLSAIHDPSDNKDDQQDKEGNLPPVQPLLSPKGGQRQWTRHNNCLLSRASVAPFYQGCNFLPSCGRRVKKKQFSIRNYSNRLWDGAIQGRTANSAKLLHGRPDRSPMTPTAVISCTTNGLLANCTSAAQKMTLVRFATAYAVSAFLRLRLADPAADRDLANIA